MFSAEMARSLGRFTTLRDAVADQPPSRPLAEALFGRGRHCSQANHVGPGAVQPN